jgi:hypothetical protein
MYVCLCRYVILLWNKLILSITTVQCIVSNHALYVYVYVQVQIIICNNTLCHVILCTPVRTTVYFYIVVYRLLRNNEFFIRKNELGQLPVQAVWGRLAAEHTTARISRHIATCKSRHDLTCNQEIPDREQVKKYEVQQKNYIKMSQRHSLALRATYNYYRLDHGFIANHQKNEHQQLWGKKGGGPKHASRRWWYSQQQE